MTGKQKHSLLACPPQAGEGEARGEAIVSGSIAERRQPCRPVTALQN